MVARFVSYPFFLKKHNIHGAVLKVPMVGTVVLPVSSTPLTGNISLEIEISPFGVLCHSLRKGVLNPGLSFFVFFSRKKSLIFLFFLCQGSHN